MQATCVCMCVGEPFILVLYFFSSNSILSKVQKSAPDAEGLPLDARIPFSQTVKINSRLKEQLVQSNKCILAKDYERAIRVRHSSQSLNR